SHSSHGVCDAATFRSSPTGLHVRFYSDRFQTSAAQRNDAVCQKATLMLPSASLRVLRRLVFPQAATACTLCQRPPSDKQISSSSDLSSSARGGSRGRTN